MTRPTVLILGATGRLGHAAVQAFAAAGWRVLAQQRRAPAAALPAGAEWIDTPLDQATLLASRAVGARALVYGVNPLYHRWDAELLPLARQGMDVAERLGATFMLPGNVYNFGPHLPALLRADTPQPGGTPKGRQRCALEGELRTRAAQGRLRSVVIRAGDFYGGGAGSWFDQAIVKDLARGKLVYPGPLDLAHAWAYLPDLARAFVAVALRAGAPQTPAFETLHFAGHTLTGRELLAGIEAAAADLGLQRRWRHAGLPWGVVRLVGLVHPIWRELARMSYLWRVPHALDGASLDAAVGVLPVTAPGPALRQALIELGHAPAARPALAA
jgi:nucleoside-diphosphate-sugar epimerase